MEDETTRLPGKAGSRCRCETVRSAVHNAGGIPGKHQEPFKHMRRTLVITLNSKSKVASAASWAAQPLTHAGHKLASYTALQSFLG